MSYKLNLSTLLSPSALFSTAITTHGINISAIVSPVFKTGKAFGFCIQSHLRLQIFLHTKFSTKSKKTIPFFLDEHNPDLSMILKAPGYTSSKFDLKLKKVIFSMLVAVSINTSFTLFKSGD